MLKIKCLANKGRLLNIIGIISALVFIVGLIGICTVMVIEWNIENKGDYFSMFGPDQSLNNLMQLFYILLVFSFVGMALYTIVNRSATEVDNISKLLLKKGKQFYYTGITLMLVFVAGLLLFVTIIMITALDWGLGHVIAYIAILGINPLINGLILISYLMMSGGIVGVVLYFLGLHYLFKGCTTTSVASSNPNSED